MELNLKILAPLLQCTSIDRCALFMRAKKKKLFYWISLSSSIKKKNFLFLSFSFSLSGFSSSSFFLFQSSILIKPCLFTQSVAPLYSILTLRFCPAPTEAQPSANHSLRSPPQRPNLRAPPSLCYLMTSVDVGLCLCFPICCGQWACVCVCGSGLVLVVGVFFFFYSAVDCWWRWLWLWLRKKIGDLGFYFFIFFPYCGLVVVVVVVVADGRGGCGWCCDVFLGSRIYYFIVVVIVFYCDVYIILLCWKLK